MNIKKYPARFVLKGDTEANWAKATDFIPLDRELVEYKPDNNHKMPRFKIGNGVTKLNELPFILDANNNYATREWVEEQADLLAGVIVEAVKEEISALPQADFEQNDSTAKDFIKNKPFYDNSTLVFEWDGKLTWNKHYVEVPDLGYLVKLSDTVYSAEELSSCVYTLVDPNSNRTFTGYCKGAEELDGMAVFNGLLISISSFETVNQATGMNLLTSNGTYVIKQDNCAYISKLIHTDIKKLDSKYLPSSAVDFDALNEDAIIATFEITEENRSVQLDLHDLINAKIIWGDSYIDTDCSQSIITHTYPTAGTYKCRIYGLTDSYEALFRDCRSLTSVVIGDSVTSIGEYTFSGCSSLTSVAIGDSVESIGHSAFLGCSGLTEIVIPGSVKSIGYSAFRDCSSLTSVVIPDSVESIGESTFSGCSSLTSVVIGDSVESIGGWAFDDCRNLTSVVVPDSVESIDKSAFYNCTNLTSVVIGNSVTSIGSAAFSGCGKLKEMQFKSAVPVSNSISNWLPNCPLLETIYVPFGCGNLYKKAWPSFAKKIVESDREMMMSDNIRFKKELNGEVTTVNFYFDSSQMDQHTVTFKNLKDLTEIDWGDGTINNSLEHTYYAIPSNPCKLYGITEIGDSAFTELGSGVLLAHVDISNTVRKIGNSAFNGCGALSSVTLGNRVEEIGYKAFYNCMITHLVIPSSVKSIGYSAFEGCGSLKSVVIPDSVESIDADTFRGCSYLMSVVIGDSVESIGVNAFLGCSSLTTLTFTSPEVKIKNIDFLANCTALTHIYVPYGCGQAYKEAWSDYADIIVESDREAMMSEVVTLDTEQVITANKTIKNSDAKLIVSDTFDNSSNLRKSTLGHSSLAFNDGAAVFTATEYKTDSIAYTCASSKSTLRFPNEVGPTGYIDCSGTIATREWVNTSTANLESELRAENEKLRAELEGRMIIATFSITEDDITNRTNTVALQGLTGKTAIDWGDGYVNSAWTHTYEYKDEYKNPETGICRYTCKIYGVTSIGLEAFRGCSSLTSVEIGASVTSIDYGAFEGCSSLTEIVIPDSVTWVGDYTFWGCSSLTEIVIPDSVESIGERAFEYCSSLTSVVIGDGVTSIGDSAFRGCSSLTRITLPFTGDKRDGTGSTYFGYIFGATSYFENTQVPESLKTVVITGGNTIYDYAFYDCRNLTEVVIPDSVTSIGFKAFHTCYSLSSVEIPDSVTSIGEQAFAYCSSLTSVVIPDSVESISRGMFFSCTSLADIEICDGVKEICQEAFQSCTSLTEITLPKTIINIGTNAFMFVPNLTVHIKVENPTSLAISDPAFQSNNKILVPKGKKVDYRTKFSSYASQIYEDCKYIIEVNDNGTLNIIAY